MKGFVFNVLVDERGLWADNLRQQIPDDDTVVIIDCDHCEFPLIGVVETDNPEVELLLRLKFPDIGHYDANSMPALNWTKSRNRKIK
jgi:hypothetical protein